MRLPNFYNHDGLKDLKRTMGVAEDVFGGFRVEIHESMLTLKEVELLGSSEGLEIDGSAIGFLADGTLVYKNTRVLLYIRDKSSISSEMEYPRFHISNCSTLRQMRSYGRWQKYVVATSTNGIFKVNFFKGYAPRTEWVKLRVCKN